MSNRPEPELGDQVMCSAAGDLLVVNSTYAVFRENRIMLSRSTGPRRRQQRSAEASGRADRGYRRKPR
jgi:hypothetical protein